MLFTLSLWPHIVSTSQIVSCFKSQFFSVYGIFFYSNYFIWFVKNSKHTNAMQNYCKIYFYYIRVNSQQTGTFLCLWHEDHVLVWRIPQKLRRNNPASDQAALDPSPSKVHILSLLCVFQSYVDHRHVIMEPYLIHVKLCEESLYLNARFVSEKIDLCNLLDLSMKTGK